MFDPQWMEEMTVDALYGAGILLAAAVVFVVIGVAIGWAIWA